MYKIKKRRPRASWQNHQERGRPAISRRPGRSPWKEVNRQIRKLLNCLNLTDRQSLLWMRVVYHVVRRLSQCSHLGKLIDRVAERVSSWGGSLHYWQFFHRLTLYYTIEKWFFIKSFQIFFIHGGTEAISYIRMCVRVAMRGIPLYSRNTARRHVCIYVCVYTKAFKSRQVHLGLSSWSGWALAFIYLFSNK